MDFGMGLASAQVPALADNAALTDYNATYARIRGCGVEAMFGQSQRLRHETMVSRREHASVVFHSVWNLSGCWRE
jgi:hypothetical protein